MPGYSWQSYFIWSHQSQHRFNNAVAKCKLHVVKNDQMKDHNRNLSATPQFRICKYTWLADLGCWSPSSTMSLAALESTSPRPRRALLQVTIAYWEWGTKPRIKIHEGEIEMYTTNHLKTRNSRPYKISTRLRTQFSQRKSKNPIPKLSVIQLSWFLMHLWALPSFGTSWIHASTLLTDFDPKILKTLNPATYIARHHQEQSPQKELQSLWLSD
jgi:hypothetical protein